MRVGGESAGGRAGVGVGVEVRVGVAVRGKGVEVKVGVAVGVRVTVGDGTKRGGQEPGEFARAGPPCKLK